MATHGKVFDIYDPINPDKLEGFQGNIFNMVEAQESGSELFDMGWATKYGLNVINHEEVCDYYSQADY